MPDFKGINNLYLIIIFIVPGLIIVFVRSRFISGRTPSQTENILGYIVVSLLYYALILPFIESVFEYQGPLIGRAIFWVGMSLVGPAIFGVFLGAWAQKDWGTWIANRIGLSTVHLIPAAWDWRFSKMPQGGMFVMVTLTSGERVAGFFGTNSFASSDMNERDIYIEEEYTVDDNGTWNQRSAKVGIFISAKEIRYIEFWEN